MLQQLRQSALNAVASALNLSASSLQQQLQSGQTIADVAKAQNVDPSTVQKAVTDSVQSQLNQDVQSGQLTANQTQNLLSNLTARFGQQAQGAGGHHHHHHHGGSDGGQAQSPPIDITVLNYTVDGDSVNQNQPSSTGQQLNAEA